MRRLLAALLFAGIATAASAQVPPAPKFTPFTVDEAAAQELRAWLNEQPFKFAAPVLQWLAQREAIEAQKAAQPAPKPPQPPQ